MKILLSLGAMVAVLGLAMASTFAQTQSTTSSSTTYVQTSKLVGTKVKSSQGEEIGVVKDVVPDRNTGCMAYTVHSTGGGGARVSRGGKMVAVPWTVYSPTSDLSVMTVTVDRERIYNAPVFDYARIDEYSRPDYINNVYGYYGVSPAAGVGVGVSTGTTTTTGAAGTAGATASPGAMGSPTAPGTASPSTRASVSPGATAAASPQVTASASPSGAATASPSTRGTRGARGRAGATASPSGGRETASPSGGRETASPSGPEESPPGAA